MTTHTFEVHAHAELEPPRPGHGIAASDIGPGGERVDLWAAEPDALFATVTAPNGVRFPRCTLDTPVPCVVTSSAGTEVSLDVTLAHPHVQPLPGGRLLVAGSRCRYEGEATVPNAAVHDDAGRVVATGLFGDGIAHVRTTGRGEVWVGYFDEGVFGNFGWGPDAEPLGAPGIVRYDAALTRSWAFPGGGDAPYPADCYALNVTDADVWACYYTDFPVVRVTGDEVTAWENPDKGSGARALVADGLAVALVGGYGDDRDRVVVGDLDGAEFRPRVTGHLVLPGGEALPPGVRFVGRGPELHLLDGPRWWRVDLNQLTR